MGKSINLLRHLPFWASPEIQNLPLAPLSNENLSYNSKFKPKSQRPWKIKMKILLLFRTKTQLEELKNLGEKEESTLKSFLQNTVHCISPPPPLHHLSSKHHHHHQRRWPWLFVNATKKTSLLSLYASFSEGNDDVNEFFYRSHYK